MFSFCQMFFSRAEFGLPNDLGYEEERRLGPWAHIVMCPQACGDAVETLRPARNSEFTSYFNIDFKCDVRICSFPAELDILTFFYWISQLFGRAFQVVSF